MAGTPSEFSLAGRERGQGNSYELKILSFKLF